MLGTMRGSERRKIMVWRGSKTHRELLIGMKSYRQMSLGMVILECLNSKNRMRKGSWSAKYPEWKFLIACMSIHE